jgi:hypothetical protein
LRRIVFLLLCVALGFALGFAGSLLSGSHWWYLAIPGAIAAGWLAVANPERCTVAEGQRQGSSSAAYLGAQHPASASQL